MGVEIKINIELSPRQKKVVRVAVVTGAVIGALGIGIAVAAPIDTTWVVGGQPVAASSLKGNLDGLQGQITKPIVTKNGKQYSIGATYCGKTAPTNGQITNGYAGAKSQCESVTTCSSSPSAHMCSLEEMARSAEVGIAIDQGWYTGANGAYNVQGYNAWDCNGWTSPATNQLGPWWSTSPIEPSLQPCNTSFPILCCD